MKNIRIVSVNEMRECYYYTSLTPDRRLQLDHESILPGCCCFVPEYKLIVVTKMIVNPGHPNIFSSAKIS